MYYYHDINANMVENNVQYQLLNITTYRVIKMRELEKIKQKVG